LIFSGFRKVAKGGNFQPFNPFWNPPMSTAIKLDDALVEAARIYGEGSHRSTPKQIEHWATLGRIAEQNPDLPYDSIVGILRARAQAKAGEVSEYRFG
jgi:hypothetical protein